MEQLPDLPPQVQKGLDGFVAAARTAFDADLVSIILFGSAAEGRLRATSDVNLLLVLKQFDRARADGIREALQMAHAAFQLSVMFLLESEIGPASEAFAVKFSDILSRHRVLYGANPFNQQAISRVATIGRIKQVLLNMKLRLRERYTMVSLREEQLAHVVAEAASPIRACAYSLLKLEGREVANPRDAMRQLAEEYGDPQLQALLTAIHEAREQGALPPEVGGEMVFRLMDLVQRLHDRIEKLP